MGRPVDWHPLASSDPVPGNPYEVGVLSRRYKRTATAISTAAEKLRSIASADGWVGKAAIEFRDQARDVASSIERAEERYSETGEALGEFQPKHEDAQDRSASALESAQDAKDDEERYQRLYDTEEAKEEPDQSLLTVYRNRITQARAAYTRAERAMERAVTSYENAAGTAASRIHEISQNDGLKTNWKDRLASILKVVADIAGLIAAVAGILALAVGWIPVIGQALAAVLGTIALIAGLVSLLANLTLAIMGEGSWMAVLLDTIGVLTFGIGRLFTTAAKFSSSSARLGSAWARALPKAGTGRITAWLTGTMPKAGNSLPILGGAFKTTFRNSFGGRMFGDKYAGLLRTAWRDSKSVWAGRANFPKLTQFPSGMNTAMRNAWNSLPDGTTWQRFQAVTHTVTGNTDLAADLGAILSKSLGPRPAAFADRAFLQSAVSIPSTLTGAGINFFQFGASDLAPWNWSR